MKSIALIVALSALAVTEASAQEGLSGRYLCIQNCKGPGPAFITQSGWDLNLVNEVGEPSRAWIDRPGHLWAQYWDEGAVFTPDGMTIQFDLGAVWQRDLGPALLPGPAAEVPPPPRVVRRVVVRRVHTYKKKTVTPTPHS